MTDCQRNDRRLLAFSFLMPDNISIGQNDFHQPMGFSNFNCNTFDWNLWIKRRRAIIPLQTNQHVATVSNKFKGKARRGSFRSSLLSALITLIPNPAIVILNIPCVLKCFLKCGYLISSNLPSPLRIQRILQFLCSSAWWMFRCLASYYIGEEGLIVRFWNFSVI